LIALIIDAHRSAAACLPRMENRYIDRKTICFKHIRELAVKHSPRWSLALRLKISPSDRICFLFTMTDNTRYAAKTRFLKQTKPRLRETFL